VISSILSSGQTHRPPPMNACMKTETSIRDRPPPISLSIGPLPSSLSGNAMAWLALEVRWHPPPPFFSRLPLHEHWGNPPPSHPLFFCRSPFSDGELAYLGFAGNIASPDPPPLSRIAPSDSPRRTDVFDDFVVVAEEASPFLLFRALPHEQLPPFGPALLNCRCLDVYFFITWL